MNPNIKTYIIGIVLSVVVLVLGTMFVAFVNSQNAYRITGRLEEVKSFQRDDDFKYLLNIRVSASENPKFLSEATTILNAHDSRIIGLVDYANKECTAEGSIIVCTYPVTHKGNITFIVSEEVGSNGLPELEGSIQ